MEWIHDFTVASVALRLGLSFLFGGIVGLERGANKHQAGLRTHILVCMGACLAMTTNLYMHLEITSRSDPGRLGAQVISGIGFLGAGLILVTSKNKVKGLTTAAGLWASACIGLALGAGFYVGGILAGLFVFISLAFLPRLEVFFYNRSRVMSIYVELDSMNSVRAFLSQARNWSFAISHTHINKSDSVIPTGYSLDIALRIPKKITHVEVIEKLSTLPGVFLVEEFE